jgi:glycoprotein endo-alpha-1,2-mannosidase
MPERRGHRRRRHRRRLNRRRLCLLLTLIFGVVLTVYLHVLRSLSISIDSSQTKKKNLRTTTTTTTTTTTDSQPAATTIFVENPNVNYNVHAFYYPWYCNPQTDMKEGYMHWNHPLLPHWDPNVAKRYPSGRHTPPDDLGSSFYPQLGAYSSADPDTIKQHMEWFVHAGVGVAVVSWLPPHKHDDNGPPIAERLPQLLDIALMQGIRIAIHMEPYEDRTPESFLQDVRQILNAHGDRPALYKLAHGGGGGGGGGPSESSALLPVLLFYVYFDQYQILSDDWKLIFQIGDFLALTFALIVEESHWKEYVIDAGFDGGYTYFASKTFTYGSNPKHWKHFQSMVMASQQQYNKLFVPSVGPGYDDTRVRPWNAVNTHDRGDGGEYYQQEWKAAVDAGVSMVSITSFNEWHEGTQIEPAIPKTFKEYTYRDYRADGPTAYLDLTRKWVERFEQNNNRGG